MPRLLLIIAFAFSTFSFQTTGFAQTVIGKAEEIRTSVRGRSSRTIKTNSSIFAKERIRTNRSGLGHFKFSDGTKLVVGPGSSITLDDLVYNPNGNTFKKIVLRSTSGATRIISGRSASSVYKIETPVGVLGLRGTAFDLRHFRGRTYLMLLSGRVEICNRRNRCQILRNRCSFVVVNRLGRVSQPTTPRRGDFSSEDMARFFPFVNNQRQLQSDYRLRTSGCQGGRSTIDGEQSDASYSPDGGSETDQGTDTNTQPDTTTTETPTDTGSTDNSPTVSTIVTSPVDVPFPDVETSTGAVDAYGQAVTTNTSGP